LENLQAADVYSAGVMLFVLRFGHLPFIEGDVGGLYSMLYNNPSKFWEYHTKNFNIE